MLLFCLGFAAILASPANEPIAGHVKNALAQVDRVPIMKRDASTVLKGWDIHLLDLLPLDLLIAEIQIARRDSIPHLSPAAIPKEEISRRTKTIVDQAAAYVAKHRKDETLDSYLRGVGASESAFREIAEREAAVMALVARAVYLQQLNPENRVPTRKVLDEVEEKIKAGDPPLFQTTVFLYRLTHDPKTVKRF